MFLKTLVVRMMAVFALMGILIGATPSQAAEKKSYTSKELKMMSAIIFCEAGNQSKAGKTAVGIVVMNRKKSGVFPKQWHPMKYRILLLSRIISEKIIHSMVKRIYGNVTRKLL